jgi:putative phosphoribosyl transferase
LAVPIDVDETSVTRHTGAINSLFDEANADPLDEARFADRHDAGRRLAPLVAGLRLDEPVIVGIPRGGVPVAAEVARALAAPLDIVVVRKIGAPQNPEFALGALAEGDVSVIDEQTVSLLELSPAEVEAVVRRARLELSDRIRRYRAGEAAVPLHGRTAVLVDDGLATGRSAQAAVGSLRKRGAARVVLAVPVAAPESLAALRSMVDGAVCVRTPDDLGAIGFWYEEFGPTAEHEVLALLAER